jgi:type IV secretory pathway VirB3-like protein
MTYQALVQFGFVFPLFGSFFTAGMFLTLPLALYSFLKTSAFECVFRLLIAKLYFVFVGIMVAVAIIGSASGVDTEITSYILLSAARFIILFFFTFSLDAYLKHRNPLFLFFVLYSLAVVGLSEGGTFVLPAQYFGDYLFEFDYQQVSLIYLVMSILLLPTLSPFRRCLFYVSTIPAMFLIGARSEFVGCLIVIVIVEFVSARMALALVLACLFLGAAFWLVAGALTVDDHRMLGWVVGGEDSSLNARAQFLWQGLDSISRNTVFGDYGGHPPGAYIHNILSAWVDFGVIGFVLALALLFLPLVYLLRVGKDEYRSPEWIRAFSSLVILIVMVVFAKAYTYNLFPVAIALYCILRCKLIKGRSEVRLATMRAMV